MQSVRILSLTCVCLSIIVSTAADLVKRSPQSYTMITAKNNTEPSSYIGFKILPKQHHLFIGKCFPNNIKYHAENIIVENDGKSQVDADIRINVEGAVNITCANILDQIPNGRGGNLHYISGGAGHNYVEFGVTTSYGQGFHLYVEIYGYESNLENEKTNL